MKDAIAYAHEAGFFSFNVIGWKSEFERLIASIRAEYEAPLKLAEEALVYHTRQTRPIHKTDEAIIAIRNTLTYLVKTPDVTVSNGNWGGRLDFKCPVCGKEFVSHQAVYSHCQNECKTLVDQCSDANKIVSEHIKIIDGAGRPMFLISESDTANKDPVSVKAAEKMGATGAEPTEYERLLFEAWMRGHCWAVAGFWDGKTYVDSAETGGYINPHVMHTRCLWASWRDRAALSAPVQPVKQEPVTYIGSLNEFTAFNLVADGYELTDPLYAAPVSAKREWVDLTDDELKAALEVHQVGLSVRIGRIAIAAFKENNK